MRLGMTPPGPANSLFWRMSSLLGQKNFPVPMAQGIWLQAIELSRRLAAKIVAAGHNFASSLLFSLLSGNSRPSPGHDESEASQVGVSQALEPDFRTGTAGIAFFSHSGDFTCG